MEKSKLLQVVTVLVISISNAHSKGMNQGMYKNRVKNDRKNFEIPALLSCE